MMVEFVSTYLSNGMTLIVVVLLVLAIAYRYYSAFIAAKVLALDDARVTPAHTLKDGQNYDPTNKWVLFGHHFAAIAGAGPLLGPVLAAQFGFLPGLLWILIGVCLAGAVQDFVVLGLSIRRGGKSLAQIAFMEIGPVAGTAATVGIIFVLVIALAGLGQAIVKALGGTQVTYAAGTHFVAPSHSAIVSVNTYDKVQVYRVPTGSVMRDAAGRESVVGSQFEITTFPTDKPYKVDLDVLTNHQLPGTEIAIGENISAVRTIAGSAWGTFTIALTIPIALFIGYYMTRLRKGKILEASIIGGVLILGAVWAGSLMDDPTSFLSDYRQYFDLSEYGISISMAVYAFIASVLPVSILLCPRDYLSSFLKIGTVGLLVIGVIFAHPHLQAPAINTAFLAGGPIVKGAIFPFVFITIMCGAISGFHALVASGTTPKMLNKEKDARPIGYGAMLLEGLVGIVALIAACSLPTAHYYHINTSRADMPAYQKQVAELAMHDEPPAGLKEVPPLSKTEGQVHETLEGRTGGAVTLAVGMAKIFDDAAGNVLGRTSAGVSAVEGMMPYWYHFAIMFEALFILTTIDAGTRVGRFLLQETMGKVIHPSLGRTANWPSAIVATTLMVGGWWYFIHSTTMPAIWSMFGIANQMLAVMALAIATVALWREGKGRYVLITVLPMCFVGVTTTTAAVIKLMEYFGSVTVASMISAGCVLVIMVCTFVILGAALVRVTRTRGAEISR